jgi:ferredoxin--NADP+ reductase
VVPGGPFTSLLASRTVGDTMLLDRTVYGFLRADRFTGGRHLWLLATGTGIAPFVAMLDDDAIWQCYADIVLVHGVRHERELAYRERVPTWLAKQAVAGPARLHYLPTLTGTAVEGLLHGRITTVLDDGRLEAAAGLPIDAADARLMICGNPSMIKDVRAWLVQRGLGPVRRETPGQFIAENFW